ncbi:MAG: hypothetical protein P0121_01230 [Nitrospira sp.]|nr:hypothetical protein [Nitrospira sp.]
MESPINGGTVKAQVALAAVSGDKTLIVHGAYSRVRQIKSHTTLTSPKAIGAKTATEALPRTLDLFMEKTDMMRPFIVMRFGIISSAFPTHHLCPPTHDHTTSQFVGAWVSHLTAP